MAVEGADDDCGYGLMVWLWAGDGWWKEVDQWEMIVPARLL